MNDDKARILRSTAEDRAALHTPDTELTFGLDGLPGLRDTAESYARDHGMTEDEIVDFLLAVNEIATNAVTHGSTRAQLRMWAEKDEIVADIHDSGDWTPREPPGHTPPPPDATGGMGLWVARRLSGDMDVQTRCPGTSVTLRFQV